ncbi:MAG TPA: PIG-L family deacetylase [Chloroflexia bacterium]|nr:PIG-L family deacetylase [Chloroflexia bacterium]
MPKEIVRSLAFQLATGFWALLFFLAGKVLRPKPARLRVTGRDHVLVIAPHPDDETLGCGGTIALHAQGNDKVCVLVVTDGGGSRAGGLTREEMVHRRWAEVTQAMALLTPSAQVVQFALLEESWSTNDLSESLGKLIEEFDPTLIYAPSCVDYHPDHIRVAEVLVDALTKTRLASCRAIRVYEVQVPLTPILANLASDITATAMRKRLALSCYQTQAESLGIGQGVQGWPYRHAIYVRLLYSVRGHSELFWEVTPEGYCEVIQRRSGGRFRFRALRRRPFVDGFAWVVGWRERVRLRHTVES